MRQKTIGRTICKTGYTRRIRPPTSYTNPLKLVSMKAYGLGTDPSAYEFDHLIPLKLGGAPSDIRNLWPESHHSPSFSYRKDGLENSLNSKVCKGSISLATAQRRIVNWTRFVSTSGGGSSTPTPAPPPTPAPTGQTKNCFSVPSACGYPDATNTGSSGTLMPAGSITASTNGQTIEGKDITGEVTVNADNVTIRNSRITATDSGGGSFAITAGNHTGLKIIDTTVRGKGPGDETLESAVFGGNHVLMERVNFTLCSDCVEYGNPTIRDSYMKISSIYSGAHAEDVYICSEAVDVEHSTLLNEQQQTATVFGDTGCSSDGNQFTVKNSLLAGGGFMLYTQSGMNLPGAETTITGNHFARCLGAPVDNSNTGGTACEGGSDANGYWPKGGYFGVGAYFGGPTTWQGNVWDDNLATIPTP